MGLLLSVIISYAGVKDAIECVKHILSGMIPEGDPDFEDLVQYYSELLHKTSSNHNSSTIKDWTGEAGQGYLCLTEDTNEKLKSAAIKYYGGMKDSTAILFSTKISSFGQNSVDSVISNSTSVNGNCGNNSTERYTTTKTIISNTSESFSIGQRNRSPTASYENVSDPTIFSGNSFDSKKDVEETPAVKEKLTWHYRPLSPTPQTLPEIHFQFNDESSQTEETAYSEEFLRSLDGIKFRPLQRSDPSGRRRSFKKRHSSSSTSSRESRASREEELKMFTSLEEAEFERMDADDNVTGFGSTPNLRSYSRSRSRENSKESRGNEALSVEASQVNANDEAESDRELKPLLKDVPKLNSFEEEKPNGTTENGNEVTDDEEDDFWGNSGE